MADIRAVGPGVWNGWKGQLLRELYYEAEAVMSGGDAAPARAARIEDAKTALAKRLADLPAPDRANARSRVTMTATGSPSTMKRMNGTRA